MGLIKQKGITRYIPDYVQKHIVSFNDCLGWLDANTEKSWFVFYIVLENSGNYSFRQKSVVKISKSFKNGLLKIQQEPGFIGFAKPSISDLLYNNHIQE